MTTIEISHTVSAQARKILENVPGITIRVAGDESVLEVGGRHFPLVILEGIRPLARDMAPFARQRAGNRLPLVVAPRLIAHVRRELEEAGLGYADGTGAAHIVAPGVHLHIEPTARTKAAFEVPTGLGVVGVRIVQCLLAEREREWTVTALATVAGCSVGEAHRLVTRLETDGFLGSTGRGQRRRRMVEHPGELLDWLATVPSARRIRERLYIYVYGTDPMSVVTRISAYAFKSKLNYVVTGAAAALALGSNVVTAIPTIMVRIDPDIDLDKAAEALEARPSDNGANVALIRDVGLLGLQQRTQAPPVEIANPVRIYLDMLTELRGDEAAALFRELYLGY
jgi:hypothetical protein